MNEVKKQFTKVIEYSQGIEDPNVDELFERWYAAKSRFIEMFGGKMIYDCGHISVPLDENIRNSKVLGFVETIGSSYDNDMLAEFVEANIESFYDNNVKELRPEWETLGVKRGMRLIKAFKYFEQNKEVLDYLQSEASRIIQENKIEGTLCFSVHPLDFLSVSANAHHWRSCHALDGEYCAGNLSYMVDNVTFICYVKSDEDKQIVGFPASVPWNSKKWRVMLYLNEQNVMMFAGKQYPFSSSTAFELARNIIIKDFLHDYETTWNPWVEAASIFPVNTADGSSYHFNLDDKKVFIPYNQMKNLIDIVINAEGALQFNDVLDSSCYVPFYTTRQYDPKVSFWMAPEDYELKPLIVGGAVKCLKCGKELITHHDFMMCTECEKDYGNKDNSLYVTCECCGGRVLRENTTWDINDNNICPECAENYYFQCDRCGYLCPTVDMKYDRATGEHICYLCAEEMTNEEEE